MIDISVELENVLLACNPIGWIDLAYGVANHGRLHRFEWSDAPSGYQVEQILRKRGVHAYGRQVFKYRDVDAEGRKIKRWKFSCWVNGEQARFAEYNLLGASVLLESPLVYEGNWANWGRGAAAPTWTEGETVRPTLMERVSDMFAGLTR